jgi:Type II secretion system (T2SS), protein J
MRARAFALIEVLVAASLLAIVGALMMTSLSSSIDAKDAVDTISNRYHLVRAGTSRIVDEISMAFMSAHHNEIEVRTKTGFLGERNRLSFTGFGYVPRVEDEKKSDQRQLTYYLDTDPRTGSQALFRREQANLDDDFEEGGRALVLLPHVRDLEFQYWDPEKDAWSEKWDAAGTELGRLPARVKIKIVAVMNDDVEMPFVTETKIWMQAPLNF